MTEVEVANPTGEVKPNESSENDKDVDESEDSSEEFSMDAEIIRSKFNNLASALQETNQNLATFEHILEHYKNLNKDSSSKSENVDIVDLLKNICGSVNDLKTEMVVNQAKEVLPGNLEYPQKIIELSDKCSKLEIECGVHKTNCEKCEEKWLEEKRKNELLESVIRDKEEKIIQLNLYLKQSEEFSTEAQRELHFMRREATETRSQLEREKENNLSIRQELEREKANNSSFRQELEREKSNNSSFRQELEREKSTNLSIRQELESYVVRVRALETIAESKRDLEEKLEALQEREPDEKEHMNLELDLDGLGQSARSTISSKSGPSEELSEQKYRELKESRNRLKQKTKLLLRQYRNKRNLLERKDRQLASQRSGLLRLQTLHQSVESNHYIVIHHLGQQIEQTARLVGALWSEEQGRPELQWEKGEGRDKLSEWISHIDNMSTWTISKLVKVSMDKRELSKRRKDGEKRKIRACEKPDMKATKTGETAHQVETMQKTMVLTEAVQQCKSGLEEKTMVLTAAARQCQTGLEAEMDTVARLMQGLDKEEDTWM